MPKLNRRIFAAHGLAWLASSPLLAQVAAASSNAASVLLAQNYSWGTDPRPYLVSEKLDGVRALWTGQLLLFRSGRRIAAPAWFTARLPATPLDGELWFARGQFEALSATVRRTLARDEEWQRVQYMVFEKPQGEGNFAQRAQQLKALVQAAQWPQLQAVDQFSVNDEVALRARLATVVQAGGEGLVLHLSSATYTSGRNAALLKLKPQQDAEARVLAHGPGKGKYEGLLGALTVQDENGKRFKIGAGLSDARRRSPPPVGSLVTYTYRGTTAKGLPRFATFLRMHDDA